MKSEFLNTLQQRGFIHQATDLEGLDAYLAKTPEAKAYIGFDCTAPTLHVGSLVQIMMLRHFQAAGHTPVVLMGGGTTKVGDPSGKTEVRKILSHADIDLNVAGIKTIFDRFLDFGKGGAVLVETDEVGFVWRASSPGTNLQLLLCSLEARASTSVRVGHQR